MTIWGRSSANPIRTERSCGPMQYTVQGWLKALRSEYFSADIAYQKPSLASKPLYAGNIAEWKWRHGAGADEHAYVFSYDGFSRLTGAKQYRNGVATADFLERGIAYDLNGNIRKLSRVESGIVTDSLRYDYDGNRLMRLTPLKGDAIPYVHEYDSNGNRTDDSRSDLYLTYNLLNRIQKVQRGGTVLANYSYLADGTKLTATDSNGEGFGYLGSLIYRTEREGVRLESATVTDGCIRSQRTASGTSYVPNYYLTDHLGSVRAVVDGLGEVVERNDYLPFGMRWNDPSQRVSDNRYWYNGKDEQTFAGLPFTDYGARMYEAFFVRWFNVDPLAEKYSDISLFAYCVNNPVKFIDPDGRDVDISDLSEEQQIALQYMLAT